MYNRETPQGIIGHDPLILDIGASVLVGSYTIADGMNGSHTRHHDIYKSYANTLL